MPPGANGAETDALIGTTIDRYRLVQKIGEGGMGTVYAVEHVLLRKRMAMKLLRAEFGRNPELVQRFQNEAVAASSVGQENIVSVTDFGWTQEGIVYLVMEELQGSSLAQAISDQPGFEVRRALEVAVQICKAFTAAHAAGIVHRDLKPDNVFLVSRPGQPEFVKVLDFGISKVVEGGADGERLTKTGMILGTPEYMSPEQSAGRPVDLRTDIYSWGVVLFEMLTGRLPFQADNPIAMLMKHQTEPPAAFADVRPDLDLSPQLERIVRKALAKRLQDRYQTMAECLVEVQRFQAAAKDAAPMRVEGAPLPSPSAPVHQNGRDTLATPTPTPTPLMSRPPPFSPRAPDSHSAPSSTPTPTPTPLRAAGISAADQLVLLKGDLRKETLTPEEGFVASRLIGLNPSFGQLVEASGLPRARALEIINGLIVKGIIGKRASSAPRPAPGSAAEQSRDQERRDRTKDNPLVSRFVRKQVLVQRAREALARGHVREALASFRTAAALDPKDADLNRLIEDAQAKVDQSEAERLFQEGTAAEAKKDFAAALDRFRRAMELRPGNGRYVERVARKLLYQQEGFTEAKKLADRAVQLLPNDAEARATLARAYLIAGLKGKARRELELVLELNKEHKFARSQMKRLRWWGGA
ncbi:MAG: serine/threonine protein kinase [Myxococcales bacterium]